MKKETFSICKLNTLGNILGCQQSVVTKVSYLTPSIELYDSEILGRITDVRKILDFVAGSDRNS